MNALAAVATALAVALAVPDIAPNPRHRRGIDLAPRTTTEVAMRAEVVEVTIHEAHAEVSAVFVMVNTSDREESLEVGFPTAARAYERRIESHPEPENWIDDAGSIYGFVARVDGVKVEAAHKSVDADDPRTEHRDWVCWPMHFAPNETRRVEVGYEVETKDATYLRPFSPLQPREVTYVLKTGRGWKDTIGRARVVVRTAGTITFDHIVRMTPAPTSRSDDALEWRYEDFEPDADITIRYNAYLDAADAIARITPRLAEHDEDAEMLLDWAENQAALGEHALAAPAFERIATWRERHRRLAKPVFTRCYGRPVEYLTARSYRFAGDLDAARRWIEPAVAVVEKRMADRRRMIELGVGDADNHADVARLGAMRAELEAWRREVPAQRR